MVHTESDSLRVERRETILAGVSGSKASLTIPVESLRSLPPLAVYVQREGQAMVRVSYRLDTVYVEATCDSLQRVVSIYEERERVRIRSETAVLADGRGGGGIDWVLLLLVLIMVFGFFGLFFCVYQAYRRS